MKTIYISFCLAFAIIKCDAQIIKVEKHDNYSEASLKKLTLATHLLDSILSTNEFRKRVLDAKLIATKGKSNKEIYDYLMSGNTEYESANDKIINLYLEEYANYAGGNEIGHTIGKKTSTHRCFILQNDVACLAGHLIHEYLHVMGFTHRRLERPKKKTVPYVIGNIIKDMLGHSNCPSVHKDCN